MFNFISNTKHRLSTGTVGRPCLLLALISLSLHSLNAQAQYEFRVIAPPGAEFTQAFGINNAGKVTGGGQFEDGTGFSYVYDLKRDKYSFNEPDFGALEINNNGVIVGDIDGVCAIRDKKGKFKLFSPPSNKPDDFCQARGVNPSGKVSGFLVDEFGTWTGFVYDSRKNSYEEFMPSSQTIAHAVNAQGQVAGSVTLEADEASPGSPAGRYGFIRAADGTVKYLAIGDLQAFSGTTRARGISESGLVAGFYRDTNTASLISYVLKVSDYTSFESITLTDDQMVYQTPCDSNMAAPPGPGYDLYTDVTASQVRNDGVVVGSCSDIYFNEITGDLVDYSKGFIATPIK